MEEAVLREGLEAMATDGFFLRLVIHPGGQGEGGWTKGRLPATPSSKWRSWKRWRRSWRSNFHVGRRALFRRGAYMVTS